MIVECWMVVVVVAAKEKITMIRVHEICRRRCCRRRKVIGLGVETTTGSTGNIVSSLTRLA